MELRIFASLDEAVREICGSERKVIGKNYVAGGDINTASALLIDDGTRLFMKSNAASFLKNFKAEAQGLAAIRQAGGPMTPRVLGAGSEKGGSFLLLEYISGGAPVRDYWETFAAQLAAIGGRVLYIDAEEVQNFGEFLQTQGDNKWAKDTMSLAFMNPQADANALNEHIQRGAFDYVPAFKSPLFAYNIGLQSYYNMAEKLAAGRQYEYIVIEHGNALTKDLAMFLGKSTTIVMCTDQGIGAAERIERFMDNLIDFKGQCMLLCSQDDEGESDFGQNPIVYRYPVCETVRRQKERTTPEEMLAKGLYRAAAAAVR